jgi:hypothetical protein
MALRPLPRFAELQMTWFDTLIMQATSTIPIFDNFFCCYYYYWLYSTCQTLDKLIGTNPIVAYSVFVCKPAVDVC